MSLSDRGCLLFRLPRGADAAGLDCAELRRQPLRHPVAGDTSGGAAQHFFRLRVALPVAIIVVVITEMIGDFIGLGDDITIWSTRFTFANVYAAIIVIGICGLVLDQALLLLRRRAVHWQREGA